VTLRTRLTAAFLVVVLGPLLAVLAVVTTWLPERFGTVQERGLRDSGRLLAELVESRCDRALAAAEIAALVASAPTTAGQPPLPDRLADLVGRGLADGFRVISPTGATAATAGTAPDLPAAGCASRAPTVSGRVAHITAVVPLRRSGAGASDPEGAAVAGFALDRGLADQLAWGVAEAGVALLVDGRPVAASPTVPSALLEQAAEPGPAGDRVVRADGRTGVLVPAGPGRPVAVLVVADRPAGAVRPLFVVVAIAALALVPAVGIAVLVARATTRPLGELGEAAARVAGGDLHTTIEVRSRDELGLLAASFNTMTEELRRYVGALEDSRNELQAGVARIGDALAGTHDVDRIVQVVLDTAIAAARARAGAVWLVDQDGTTLQLAVSEGFAGGVLPAASCRSARAWPVGSPAAGSRCAAGRASATCCPRQASRPPTRCSPSRCAARAG
jgi:HAMP domain-containing protein